ncbi:tRNA (guanosine(37)-N1)-methyltransferase TrmD [Thermincola potens]|uniref:tRNA (guanine-N(1)-)-methyltransferase n=1 Tax=Thermincola potens (strain JR) TaxID=635013 RepID=D5X8L5_THEPJ|nr:tRNA (guanosine(37)-N1)-methyltransferase TrmD [Thermincola potens]ADG82891.1 tRNA (guanine-N1)-methyltransferase [Thermincola potens JR]
MRFDILTLFPEMFVGPFGASIIKRAVEKGLIEIHTTNIRDFAEDKHRIVDDYPFGGGAGMVMKPEPIFKAVESLMPEKGRSQVILLSPQGIVYKQEIARKLSQYGHIVLICGHYEGVDERIKSLIDMELSIGDYILTGGELAAMVVVDSVARLIPGVLGDEESAKEESFSNNLLEYPHYTRPREFRGMSVPDILLSGNHEKIRAWRLKQSLLKTLQMRPDLLSEDRLTPEQRKLLAEEIEAEAYNKRVKKITNTGDDHSE